MRRPCRPSWREKRRGRRRKFPEMARRLIKKSQGASQWDFIMKTSKRISRDRDKRRGWGEKGRKLSKRGGLTGECGSPVGVPRKGCWTWKRPGREKGTLLSERKKMRKQRRESRPRRLLAYPGLQTLHKSEGGKWGKGCSPTEKWEGESGGSIPCDRDSRPLLMGTRARRYF